MTRTPFFATFEPGPDIQHGWVALGVDYWQDILVILTCEHTAPGPQAARDIMAAWTALQSMTRHRAPWSDLWTQWATYVQERQADHPYGLSLAALVPGDPPLLWVAGHNAVPVVGWRGNELWIPGPGPGMQVTGTPGDLYIWGTPNLWNVVQRDDVMHIIHTSTSTTDIGTRLVALAQQSVSHAFGVVVTLLEGPQGQGIKEIAP
jgi:hypothetical protein